MKRNNFKQYRLIEAGSINDLETKVNDAIRGLQDYNPVVVFSDFASGFFARIEYEECEEIVETIADEFHLQGLRYVCSQCPLHDEIEDRRRVMVGCDYAEFGETNLKHECCEMFYRELKAGRLKPVEQPPRMGPKRVVDMRR